MAAMTSHTHVHVVFCCAGSPFKLRVSAAGFVKVHGPGLEDSLIQKATGKLFVDTLDAPPGDVRIRVGGPKGTIALDALPGDVRIRVGGPKGIGRYTVRQGSQSFKSTFTDDADSFFVNDIYLKGVDMHVICWCQVGGCITD